MSDARNAIFEALEAAAPPPPSARARRAPPTMPEDADSILCDRLAQNGGRLVRAAAHEDWLALDGLPPFASFDHVYIGEGVSRSGDQTGTEGHALVSRGVGSTAHDGHDLAALDLCLLRGRFVVVENGAVWQEPATALERAAALLAEHLVVVVDETERVPTLHQAYDRIALGEIPFGWFLCGPSKTADIEQALVLGAHGPRTMHLVLLER